MFSRAIAVVFFALIMVSWVAMAVSIVQRNDDHAARILSCMTTVRHQQHVSPQEAYLICHKENR